ncbi:MAG: TonB-dependent receptor plug domain-containing protein [Reyranellaceae bacterium]
MSLAVHTSSRPFRAILLSTSVLIAAGAAQAQQTAVVALPETVVTATRDEEKTERLANSITVVDRQEIERRQYKTVQDVLSDVPGVAANQSGPFGKTGALFIRGTNANHALVLVDGLRANDPGSANGTFNFAHILTDMVERIEIVRGPLSTLYGSDALGGVVNIITRKGSGKPSVALNLEGGSFQTLTGSAAAQGAIERFNFNVGVAGFRTDGISVTPKSQRLPGMQGEDDPYRNLTLNARLGMEVTDNFEISLFGRYIKTRSEYDNWPVEDPNMRENSEQFYGRALGELWLMDGRWKQSFGVGYAHIYRRDRDEPDTFNPFPFTLDVKRTGQRLKGDWQNDVQVADFWKLTFGVEGEKEWYDSDVDGLKLDADATTVSGFLQNRFTIMDRLFLTLAARLDHHSDFGAHPTFSAGIAYLHRETGTKLKASVGTAFKAPTLDQLYGKIPAFGFSGNSDLDPEKSVGFDIGFEQSLFGGKLQFGSTYFRNWIRDLIDFDATFSTLINIDKVRSWGLESFVAVQPVSWLTARLDHTWIRTEDRATGLQLARRPKHKITGAVDITPIERLTLGLSVTWNDERVDFLPDFTTGKNPGYTVARFTASYQVTEELQFYGRIENAFDKRYDDPAGYAQPGFAVYAGTRVTF